MHHLHHVWLVGSLAAVIGCGSQSANDPDFHEQSSSPTDGSVGEFPAPLPGYTRIVANTVKNIPPGGDITMCQYLMPPLDHDVDVEDVVGYQSKFGHHLIAMTYAASEGEEVGTEFSCMGSDIGGSSLAKTGQFLGAAADGKRSNVSPPEGVALRLKKGVGVQVNLHFINVGSEPVDGNGVIDLKLVPTDASKPVAGLFANNVTEFSIAPGGRGTASVDCHLESDIRFVMVGNHMHEHGVSATTELVHADGTVTDLHTDEKWSQDAVGNPEFTHYSLEAPAIAHAGEVVRTRCNYENTTTQTLSFPTEMCSAVGMAISDNPQGTVPSCLAGTWFPNGF